MKVSILLTHHLSQNNDYLLAALRSISWQKTQCEINTILISSADNIPEIKMQCKIIADKKLDTYTKKHKHFLSVVDQTTDYVLILSDDVMMSEYCIEIMTLAAKDIKTPLLMNPLCNGDVPAKYITPVYLLDAGKPVLVPTVCDLSFVLNKEHMVKYWPRRDMLIMPADHLATYCTLVSMQILKEIEPDDRLHAKYWDTDFCFRAGKKGYPSFLNFGAFALHFGSKTLNNYKTKEMEKEMDLIFADKVKSGVYDI